MLWTLPLAAVAVIAPAALPSASLSLGPIQSSLFQEVHGMLPNRATWPLTAVFGDVDGDGQADLIVGRDLYLNAGAGQFVDPSAGLPFELSPEALVDVDGDGDLDALSKNGLLLGSGGGQFQPAPAGQIPAAWGAIIHGNGGLLTGDVDGDGDLDVLFCNRLNGNGGQNQLFLNDGAGTFSDETAARLPVEAENSSLGHLDDVDGDGDLDFLCLDELDQRLYLNNGSGAFTAVPSPLPAALQGSGAVQAIADLNGDGSLDLLVRLIGQTAPESRLLLNDGTGGFTDASAGFLSSAARALPLGILADVDGDGDVDAVTVDGSVTTALNDGSGRLLETVSSRTTEWHATGQLRRLTDVDGDGDLDLWIGRRSNAPSGAPQPVQDILMLGDGTGRFTDVTAADLPFSGLRVNGALSDGSAPFDYDGDGDLDIVFRTDLPGLGSVLSYFENDGTGSFVDALARRLPAELRQPQFTGVLASFDANGDGRNDLIALQPPRLFLNDGAGRFQAAPTASLPPGLPSDPLLPMGDADRDGDVDLLRLASTGPELLLNDGAGVFTPAPPASLAPLGARVRGFEALDLDGDQAPELILSDFFSRTWVLKNDGAGRFTDETSLRIPDPDFGPRSLESADLDGDGDVDLLLHAGLTSGLRLYLNDGAGVLLDASAALLPQDSDEVIDKVLLGDVDADGDIDAVLGGTRLYLNEGPAGFASASPDAFHLYASAFRGGALKDLDGDGDLDLFVQTERAAVYRNVTRQLAWRAVPRLGQPLTLDVYGPPGASFTLFLRTAGTFGGSWSLAQTGTLDAQGRASYSRQAPASPNLVGTELRAVARINGRFSNVERVTLTDL